MSKLGCEISLWSCVGNGLERPEREGKGAVRRQRMCNINGASEPAQQMRVLFPVRPHRVKSLKPKPNTKLILKGTSLASSPGHVQRPSH